MREGGIKKNRGCLYVLLAVVLGPPVLATIAVPFVATYNAFEAFVKQGFGAGISGLFFAVIVWALYFGVFWVIWKFVLKKGKKTKEDKPTNPYAVVLETTKGKLILNNPFRGVFVAGAAGSGKSESVAVPLMKQYIEQKYAGIVYDFKFPTLANDVESFLGANSSGLRHFYLNFNNPLQSYRVNPLNPKYLPNTSYAREYASAIIGNLMKESIKKPDFWTRSATDLLTACIWYLRVERPDICDLPHVFAMITSNDVALLKTLQKNEQTAQMTISIYNAMERGADSQVSGVIGTLQGAIAQINTPELMYIFSKDDFSLDVNDPANPILLTVGSYPTLTSTFAPLCSLVITVATKLMNQPSKTPSFVLLDEAPTCFVPNLEILPNTGRSNKISTVLMCQDLAQLTDGYGKEKADVLFAACNNHFYGRVASSITADQLSKQFGKRDKVYTTSGTSSKNTDWISRTWSDTETIQERDVLKGADILRFGVGEFAGILVESNIDQFRRKFIPAQRPPQKPLSTPQTASFSTINDYYKTVRHNVKMMLESGGSVGEYDRDNVKLHESKRNKFEL